jgi:hypothetical protein
MKIPYTIYFTTDDMTKEISVLKILFDHEIVNETEVHKILTKATLREFGSSLYPAKRNIGGRYIDNILYISSIKKFQESNSPFENGYNIIQLIRNKKLDRILNT